MKPIITLSFLLFLSSSIIAQCDLESIEINTLECNMDGSYSISLESNPADIDVDIELNSSYLGFYQLDSTALIIDPIMGNGITKDTFVICQNDLDTCCVELIVNNPCLCGFANMTYDIFDCDQASNTFSINLDFEPQNNGSQFVVGGNGNTYGTFEYGDLPITLGPLTADNTEYEFIFFDADDALCFDFIEVGEVDCAVINACEISNVHVEAGECNDDGVFFVDLEFDVVNPGNSGFTIQGNGMNYGNFQYGEDYYNIGPLEGDCTTLYEFIVIDNEDQICQNFTELEEVICCPVEECNLVSLFAEAQPCEGEGFNILIDIESNESPDSEKFNLFINGLPFSSFDYGNQSIGFGPFTGDCSTIWEFQIVDQNNEECQLTFAFEEPICCEVCSLGEIEIELMECDEEEMSFILDFEFIGNASSFDLTSRDGYFGTFLYTDLPLAINGYPNTGAAFEFIKICDNDVADECCAEFEWNVEECTDDNIECLLSELTVEVVECDSLTMAIIIDIEYEGVTNQSFDVFSRDGFFGFYSFSDLPLTIEGFPNTGSEFEFIRICENDNEDCCIEAEWNVGDCTEEPVECKLTELSIELLECDSLTMDLTIDFDFQGTTNQFFDIYSRDGFFNFYSFSDLPLTIEDFPNTGNEFEFIKICENDNENCCVEAEWNVEECTESLNNGNIEYSTISYMLINNELIFDTNVEEIALYNTLGQNLSRVSSNQMDVGSYPTGIYIATVNHNGIRSSIKFFKP